MENSGYAGPGVSEWLMFKFRIPRYEYAELAKSFNPDKSFARNIALLAKEAGMKYVVVTSKHHDGFALFDSECSDSDIVDRTPYKADAIKELYFACLAEGLAFGVYYSHGNDWYDGTDGNYANVKKVNDSLGILSHAPGKNLWDPSPNTHAQYLENKALPQIKELLAMMPELRLIWFDGGGYISEKQAFQFYKTIFDINPRIIVNRRVGYDFGDYLDAGDNVIPSASDILSKHWETCGTTNNSWAYKSYDDDWKSTQKILYYLVDIASRGGNYLLNIGPDGER
jgi:alpha-L-fucosidase